MRRQLFLWMMLACITMLSSCGDDDPVDVNDYNKQTILVYMPWSGDRGYGGLYNIFKQNLDSIEAGIKAQKGLGSSRLVVFISTSAQESELYEVTYQKNECVHTPIKTYVGNEYTTAAGIARIINDVKAAAKALNYAMIIGCHGTGWTYKDNWKEYPYQAKPFVTNTWQRDTSWPMTRFFGSVSDPANYATDVEVLAEGIAQTGTRMQYILFDDCYMANIETAYMLKDVSNFLMGSTSEIIDIGIPYKRMWGSLAKPVPNYADAVRQFHNFYDKYKVASGAFAAIDCREVDALAHIMHDINKACIFDEALRDSLQVLDGFNTAIFFDMGHYVDNLCKNPSLKSRFDTQLAKVVRSKSVTDSIYSWIYPNQKYKFIKVRHFSGITISDPTQHVAPLRGLRKTGWWKATH